MADWKQYIETKKATKDETLFREFFTELEKERGTMPEPAAPIKPKSGGPL